MVLFFSFTINPPDGNTGAPGEQLCTQCHVQNNPVQDGSINLEGFPSSITPNTTYTLTAVNTRTQGPATKAGFQVTILGPLNTKAGDMKSASAGSSISTLNGRQYWDHAPAATYPDSGIVRWTVQWTAPDLPNGSTVTWFAAGNIANGDFVNTGDKIVTANGSGTLLISSNEHIQTSAIAIYPNPGSDRIHVVKDKKGIEEGTIHFIDMLGRKVHTESLRNGMFNSFHLTPGMYLLVIEDGMEIHYIKWSKI